MKIPPRYYCQIGQSIQSYLADDWHVLKLGISGSARCP
jgi:hypothetical protein